MGNLEDQPGKNARNVGKNETLNLIAAFVGKSGLVHYQGVDHGV